MNEPFLLEHDQNLIELKLFQEQSKQLTAESYQTLVHLHLIQDWLAELETRTQELADRVSPRTH